jgi:hypothetical protein
MSLSLILRRAAQAASAWAGARHRPAQSWYGFRCPCGSTGGPWPTRKEAETLAGIHDQVGHRQQPGCRTAKVVAASAFTDAVPFPGASRIVINGLSIPTRTVTR